DPGASAPPLFMRGGGGWVSVVCPELRGGAQPPPARVPGAGPREIFLVAAMGVAAPTAVTDAALAGLVLGHWQANAVTTRGEIRIAKTRTIAGWKGRCVVTIEVHAALYSAIRRALAGGAELPGPWEGAVAGIAVLSDE